MKLQLKLPYEKSKFSRLFSNIYEQFISMHLKRHILKSNKEKTQ